LLENLCAVYTPILDPWLDMAHPPEGFEPIHLLASQPEKAADIQFRSILHD